MLQNVNNLIDMFQMRYITYFVYTYLLDIQSFRPIEDTVSSIERHNKQNSIRPPAKLNATFKPRIAL
jgi:hypothetical protein